MIFGGYVGIVIWLVMMALVAIADGWRAVMNMGALKAGAVFLAAGLLIGLGAAAL